MNTTKDRSMATGPYPTRAKFRKVIITGSYRTGFGYDQRVAGREAVITLSDGSEVGCTHAHRKQETLVACATRLVRDLNDSAGIPRDKQ